MIQFSKHHFYWAAQIVGWLLLGSVNLLFSFIGYNVLPNFQDVAFTISFVIFGILLTHSFRYQIKSRLWFKFPFFKLGMVVIVAIIAMAAMMATALLLILYISVGRFPDDFLISLPLNLSNFALIFLIWTLLYFAIYTFRNYRHEEIERLHFERSLKESELARLKSQMNPHFVFNALNSIRALVAEDPEKAQQSITQLSQLLRQFLLSDRAKTITIEEELKTVETYLQLEKLRYENRLTYKLNLPTELRNNRIPAMLIQTLVENAIKHGVAQRKGGGHIEIEVSPVRDNKYMCSVTNPGDLNGAQPDTGFGLINTRQRLQLLYSNNAALAIMQTREGLVRAEVILPAQPLLELQD